MRQVYFIAAAIVACGLFAIFMNGWLGAGLFVLIVVCLQPSKGDVRGW